MIRLCPHNIPTVKGSDVYRIRTLTIEKNHLMIENRRTSLPSWLKGNVGNLLRCPHCHSQPVIVLFYPVTFETAHGIAVHEPVIETDGNATCTPEFIPVKYKLSRRRWTRCVT